MGLAGPGGAQSPGANINPSVRIQRGLLIRLEVHAEKGARCTFCAGFVEIIVRVNNEIEEEPSRWEAL